MSTGLDESMLDDLAALEAGDPGGMLRAIATAGPQIRESVSLTRETGLQAVSAEGRPRAVVVTGMGGSGVVGDVLAACTGLACPVPVQVVKGFGLPGWVGPLDVVLAISCSGRTEETLVVADEAARRGCRLVTVGAPDSVLARQGARSRAFHLPVATGGRAPRANLWALCVPVLALAGALGLVEVTDEIFASTADRLDAIAERCGPGRDTAANPAKALAAELGGRLPVIWGSGAVGEVAAYRFASQLAENAKLPALCGTLPEVGHNAVVALDGPFATAPDGDDFFRDRAGDSEVATRMSVVLLRDSIEDHRVAHRRKALHAVADERSVPVRELAADGAHAFERLASLVGVCDYASAYLALATGVDPSPIGPIDELKRRSEQ